MKKIIMILLVAFGMNAPQTSLFAQCAPQIASIQGPNSDPCEGEQDFRFILNWTTLPNTQGVFTWTRQSGASLPAGFNVFPEGNVQFTQPATVDMSDVYQVVFQDTVTGCTETQLVGLMVHPKPNGWYSLITKCNEIILHPGGGESYKNLDQNGSYSILFDSLVFSYPQTKTPQKLTNGGGFRVYSQFGCATDVAYYQIWSSPLMIAIQATKRRISPGQTSVLTATSFYHPVQGSKTKWYKNNTLVAQGCNTLTVTDTGVYKVQMRATVVAGNCVKTNQIKITPKPVVGARVDEDVESMIGQESILDLQIGPNPASDQIQISGYDEKIEILDMNGKIVNQLSFNTFEGTSPQNVDVSSLPNGMYLIRSGEQTQKMIIRR